MDPIAALAQLLSLPFLVLCVMIGLIVAGFRWSVETTVNKFVTIPIGHQPWWVWFWHEVILPVAPLLLGFCIGYFIKDYPYPSPFDQSDSGRLFIGVIAGLSSGFLYPRVKFYLKKLAPPKDCPPSKEDTKE